MVYPILAGLGAVLLRNLTGWAKNSLEDGKIQDYEWKQLAITTVQTGTLFVVMHYGFGMEELASAASAIVGDMIYTFVSKALKKKKY